MASTTCWTPRASLSVPCRLRSKIFAAFEAVHSDDEVPANTKGTDLVVLAPMPFGELYVVALAVAAVVLDGDGNFVFAGTKIDPVDLESPASKRGRDDGGYVWRGVREVNGVGHEAIDGHCQCMVASCSSRR